VPRDVAGVDERVEELAPADRVGCVRAERLAAHVAKRGLVRGVALVAGFVAASVRRRCRGGSHSGGETLAAALPCNGVAEFSPAAELGRGGHLIEAREDRRALVVGRTVGLPGAATRDTRRRRRLVIVGRARGRVLRLCEVEGAEELAKRPQDGLRREVRGDGVVSFRAGY